MIELDHFSHEHPLIFNEARDIEDEINRDHFCSICNIPILLSSFYSCSNTGCMYLLHKPCALLPETMTHPWFPSSHFRLEKIPPDHDSRCRKCRESCENFAYIDASDREITFHPTCGVVLTSPIESKHKSHPLHPLVAAVGKKTSAVCDACAEEQNGNFFMCHPCNFLIHVDCALLPRIVECRRHRHYLILSYSSTDSYQSQDPYGSTRCLICSNDMFGSGAYSCGICYGFAHLSCAIKDMENVGTERNLGVVYLPAADPSQIIPYILERGKSTGVMRRVSDHHEHPLILYDNDTEKSDGGSSNKEVALCNACIGPIYPPFYGCGSQSSTCNFHLHQLCSAIPSRIPLDVDDDDDGHLHHHGCSLFYCYLCRLLGNGFFYQSGDDVKTHITCILLNSTIKHASHKQHFLRFFYLSHTTNLIKNCCSDKTGPFLHRCYDCDFIIDHRCAFLPGKIKHKYDEHPLDLITTGIASSDDENMNICEFCEEQIDTRFWYYGCEECDNLFHVKCIPSAGSLSKVKFGNSIDVPCHPPHPVTFVRMLGFGSQNCGYCNQIVEGFVDEMAFHCEECDFWMHFKCAEECTGAEKLRPPAYFKYHMC